jgi:restriction endonuclease S subunit
VNLVPLSQVCRLVNGGTPKSGVAEYWAGDVAWLTPAEMGKLNAPEIAATARTITDAGLKNSSAKQVPSGSVILSTRAPIGHLAIPLVPMAFNQGCRGLVPGEGLDTKYLYYFLWFSREALNDLGTGTTFKELSSGALGAYKIPLPPIEEQRRIVAVLDEAFAAIATATANAEKNLTNARELFKSYLESRFEDAKVGARTEPLKQLCVPDRVITYGVIKLGEHIPDGVPCLRTSNVRWLDFNLEGMKCIKPALSKEYSRTILRGSEVLVNVRGTLGGVAVAKQSMAGWNVSREVAVVPCDVSRVDPQYLAYWIGAQTSQDWLAHVEKGVAYTGINIGDLRSLPVVHLPVEQQCRIVSELDVSLSLARDLEASYQRKIESLKRLEQSLLNRAFTGELTERKATIAAPSNDSFATPEFAAQIVAFAHARHEALGRSMNFGHVKAQKTLHAVEAVGGLDLGRQPIRDAAGPNDFAHMLQAEDWARSRRFFEFVQRTSGGYGFRELEGYDELLNEAKQRLDQVGAAKRAIELLVDMDSEWAEIVVTTHAAWNNLILDQVAITDDAIVQAARDDWHREKLRYDKSRFHDAIRFIRSNGIEPDGSAKRVGGQESLPL